MTVRIQFDNSYSRLPEDFYARVKPTPVGAPQLVKLNRQLALHIGLDPDAFISPEGLEILAGTRIPEGAEPIAMAYAGHQFGQFVPSLGDGRAILLGEVVDKDGIRRDFHLKGTGLTPFSRSGDGRAALGPVLREYLLSEAMAALGVPTTRALAAVMTGDKVYRDRIQPGAVLTRISLSHVRVGTFQYFAARGDMQSVRRLADYTIDRHYPELREGGRPIRGFLDAVVIRQAELVAKWMLVGFIHGVMNTDNTAVSGETIDYGPCAFMDVYHPTTVFSSIDQQGRYAYGNQPAIAQWNMARLAECLLPLIDENEEKAIGEANEAMALFAKTYSHSYLTGMRRKLGLTSEQDGDLALAQDLLNRMATNEADFTLTFRRLCDASLGPDRDEAVAGLFREPAAFAEWSERWRSRLDGDAQDPMHRREAMCAVNPAFIPRNHRVEEVLKAAVEEQDFAPFEQLLDVLSAPFEDQPRFASYAEPPQPHQRVHQTFCGT